MVKSICLLGLGYKNGKISGSMLFIKHSSIHIHCYSFFDSWEESIAFSLPSYPYKTLWNYGMGNLRLSLNTHRSRNRGKNEWIFKSCTDRNNGNGDMELFNIILFFSFPQELISLSSVNTAELICLGNSKDLGMLTWLSNHIFPKSLLW